MRILVGCEMTYEFPQPTPVIATLNVHASRFSDLERPDYLITSPAVPLEGYRDSFGNWCSRMVAPAGRFTLKTDTVVRDHGKGDTQEADAQEIAVEKLPSDTLLFLLGSRYCETDRLSETAWSLFGGIQPGWKRVQAIVDFTHDHVEFGYQHARSTKTAWDAHQERQGVCRDFAHLAIALCRCMNIPARYCTGYLGDIGVPFSNAPMDFSAWFDVYLGGQWHVLGARHNRPRIGRILMARGRDATDAALTTSFGPARLASFLVHTDEVQAVG